MMDTEDVVMIVIAVVVVIAIAVSGSCVSRRDKIVQECMNNPDRVAEECLRLQCEFGMSADTTTCAIAYPIGGRL